MSIFKDGIEKFGPRELSPNIIRRLGNAAGLSFLASGIPSELTDEEAEEMGREIKIYQSCAKSF
tara:strand:- start:2397 stop:2588 length:192 start_codon:yes stop_codon:yes gene_type:complete